VGSLRFRAAVALATCTFLLIIAGGLVTSTGSGLAVPDWPLSFGQVFPRMEGGVLFEHGHRLIAAAVGLVTIIVALLVQRAEPRRWVRRLAWTALLVVVVQGVLGGLTVLLRLPTAVSVAHAGLAQGFFALTIVLASALAGGWALNRAPAPRRSLAGLAVTTAVVIYVQILLGAVVRHTGAGLAIPDFPLSQGRLVPEFTSPQVVWHYLHRVGAVAALTLVFVLAARSLRVYGGGGWITRPALMMVALTVLQVLLGAFTVWQRRAVVPTTAHVAVGALVWGAAVVVALRAGRLERDGQMAGGEVAGA
jgi:cytochrome c oxidase assembly protein subunit 15